MMKISVLCVLVALVVAVTVVTPASAVASDDTDFSVYQPGTLLIDVPKTALSGVPFKPLITFSAMYTATEPWPEQLHYVLTSEVDGTSSVVQSSIVNPKNGTITLDEVNLHDLGVNTLTLQFEQRYKFSKEVHVIPAWLSILPSVITIVIAITLRQVILALLGGVWLGAFFANRYNPLTAYLRTLDTLVVQALADTDHAGIIYFCLLLGGTIAVLGKGGGAMGMAELFTKYATTRQRGQFFTWLMGCLIFFDDYANALITGSTMRPITDQLKISREKLSFIVDSCAATISSLAIVSSWIGVEVGYIGEQFRNLGIKREAYFTFLETIPYRFYPIQVLAFVFFTIVFQREFGPMLTAERRALRTGKVIADKGKPASDFEDEDIMPKMDKPRRWYNAVIPVVVIIIAIFAGLLLNGYSSILDERDKLAVAIQQAEARHDQMEVTKLQDDYNALTTGLRDLFGHSNPFHALIWASMLGSIVAIGLVVAQRILTLTEAMDAWLAGCKSMMMALLILMHAWALGNVCGEIHTADFVVLAFKGTSAPGFLPALVFVLSAFVSFATGSSWGTMSILFPLVVPLAHDLAPSSDTIMLGTISAILSGSVWGDHVSPISDSCIMSSMATSSDHADHVKTQAVYALVVGFVSILFGSLPVGFEWYNEWVANAICMCLLLGILMFVGVPVDTPDDYQSYAEKYFGKCCTTISEPVIQTYRRFRPEKPATTMEQLLPYSEDPNQSDDAISAGGRSRSHSEGNITVGHNEYSAPIYVEHYSTLIGEYHSSNTGATPRGRKKGTGGPALPSTSA
eukprot:GFYU01012246.1.p1 GENE.GFYU01012246.1~~GFYU01012246.1.p1  ORF type:complete len:799 (-),score=193.40 GFYU01012246.1:107-2503(-)